MRNSIQYKTVQNNADRFYTSQFAHETASKFRTYHTEVRNNKEKLETICLISKGCVRTCLISLHLFCTASKFSDGRSVGFSLKSSFNSSCAVRTVENEEKERLKQKRRILPTTYGSTSIFCLYIIGSGRHATQLPKPN